jgi:hypothetical protein
MSDRRILSEGEPRNKKRKLCGDLGDGTRADDIFLLALLQLPLLEEAGVNARQVPLPVGKALRLG